METEKYIEYFTVTSVRRLALVSTSRARKRLVEIPCVCYFYIIGTKTLTDSNV